MIMYNMFVEVNSQGNLMTFIPLVLEYMAYIKMRKMLKSLCQVYFLSFFLKLLDIKAQSIDDKHLTFAKIVSIDIKS